MKNKMKSLKDKEINLKKNLKIFKKKLLSFKI